MICPDVRNSVLNFDVCTFFVLHICTLFMYVRYVYTFLSSICVHYLCPLCVNFFCQLYVYIFLSAIHTQLMRKA